MNSILLDTHAFIWLAEDDPNLPVSLRDAIENTDNVFVSIASFWEISIKIKIGKLSLLSDFNEMEYSFQSTRFKLLPISLKDTIQLYNLPLYHKDPFDRILVAQAMNNSLVLISRDVAFDAYPVRRMWL
ncbi:type II toxin-antitoxin system VapC family toxin [Planktothrix sp. FACHB-1355]|uniref:Type II toxin-antitoxin system VapC family toxin n=1 Tax=Aerosakkonema funiforme FACHB-1375 TaxID=2949571 RepID=A0A926VFW4_9CYAN|nr:MULTISPECIES: type II toxin-antitoxin system VapC family toxin [Oscillatoriales]MBD2183130.1 type II toxin-antitoxin system VapC family toxin [Aerosakkonema funiforme FACHB-1375]MBD3559719.1 type II toxin-antitoxin system VapC family toxin [Planktothrix sp. FACHB-1355]